MPWQVDENAEALQATPGEGFGTPARHLRSGYASERLPALSQERRVPGRTPRLSVDTVW